MRCALLAILLATGCFWRAPGHEQHTSELHTDRAFACMERGGSFHHVRGQSDYCQFQLPNGDLLLLVYPAREIRRDGARTP